MAIFKPFVIYKQLLFYSDASAKVFLQKCFIFREIHKKDSEECKLLITQINLPSRGRGNSAPFKCFSKATCTDPPCVTAWQPEICPCSSSHISETGPLHWWYNVNTWRLASAAGPSADFAGTSVRERMGGDPTENPRSSHPRKVLGESFGWVRCVLSQKLWSVRCEPIQPLWTWRSCKPL